MTASCHDPAFSTPPPDLHFGPREVETARRAYLLAEDVTGDSFALPSLDNDRHAVDLRTLADLDPREVVPADVLAHLVRYEGQDRPVRPPRTLFRICLQDHTILRRLRAEGGAFPLFSLLVFVLTHELVHVVRFLKHHQRFDATDAEREAEESLVNTITCRLLRQVRVPGLCEVVRRFVPPGMPALPPGAPLPPHLPADGLVMLADPPSGLR